MAKKPRPEGKKYNYMDTYGDLVTLLLCFFVLLFAMSTIEEVKYRQFAEAMSARFGTPSDAPVPGGSDPSQSGTGEVPPTGEAMDPDQTLPEDMSQLAEAIQKYVDENQMQGQVSVQVGESGAVFIRMNDNLLFDGNSYALRDESIGFLDFLSDCFLEVNDQILRVDSKGHTASIQGDGTDDWILGGERAGIVSSYFEKRGGLSRYKLTATGYGRNYPIADNETVEGRAQNRRVDIVVLGNDAGNLQAALIDGMRAYFPGDDRSYFGGAPEELPDNVIDSVEPVAGSMEEYLGSLTEEELDAFINGGDLPDGGASG